MGRGWEFGLPTRVAFGRGVLRQVGPVAKWHGASALLVGYREPGPLAAAYERAEKSLIQAGLSVRRLDVADPEPTVESLLEAAWQAAPFCPGVVVALGGGSVVDVAKGLAAMLVREPPEDLAGVAAALEREVREALPIIALPTTAGTGSEVTKVAVFSHTRQDVPQKLTLVGPALAPKAAMIDPDLAVGCPPTVTAAAGADALGHAIEARLSRAANPISSLLASKAVADLLAHLPAAVERPDDPAPREPLALAAALAGAAFNDTGVTVAHALAHALGAVLHVPHAAAVAIATPPALRFNLPAAIGPLAALATACGLPGATAEERAAAFVEKVAETLAKVGLPRRAAAPAAGREALLDQLAASADASLRSALVLNPRKVDAAPLRGLFAECLESRET